MIGRLLAALLLSAVLLVAGASVADARDAPSPGYDARATTAPVTARATGRTRRARATRRARTPPSGLPRTGSNTAELATAGLAAVAVGGGMFVLARRRKLSLTTI